MSFARCLLNDEAKKQSRNYSYSKVGELLKIEDSRKGKTNYSYDRLGRVKETIKTKGLNQTQELFNFDPAHNLLNDENDKALKNNQIETYQDKRYQYDTFGNLTNKKVSNHTNMDLSYNLEHQLIEAKVTKHKNTQKPITQTYNYTYDPFGRRVSKTDAFGSTYFTWDGNRLLTETRGDSNQSYIYEQFGFTPIASTNSANNINYYHTDHLGTPQEVTNNQGEIVWEAEYETWGNTAKVSYKQSDSTIHEDIEFQPLRFQGQYFDAETGLHYNRFRYYDPDIGRFVSQDPIGLLGGMNLYQYAANPVGWVDPLGLKSASQILKDNLESSGISRPNGAAAHHIVPAGAKGATQARRILSNHQIDINSPKNGVFLPGRDSPSTVPGIKHAGGHGSGYYQAVNDRIVKAERDGGKPAVEAEIDKMRNELEGANRDAKWSEVCTL